MENLRAQTGRMIVLNCSIENYDLQQSLALESNIYSEDCFFCGGYNVAMFTLDYKYLQALLGL